MSSAEDIVNQLGLEEDEIEAGEAALEAAMDEESVNEDSDIQEVSELELRQAIRVLEEAEIDHIARGMTPEEAVEKAKLLQKVRAGAAQILSRGKTVDAFHQLLDSLPDNLHGEFVRENDRDIKRKEGLGFEVYSGAGDGTHGSGDSTSRVGDLVLMVTDKDVHRVLEQERTKRKMEKNSRRRKAEKANFNKFADAQGTGGALNT